VAAQGEVAGVSTRPVPETLARFEIIDAHTHLFPPRVARAVWRWFDRYAWPIEYRLDAPAAAALLLEGGVARVVGLHYAHVPGMAAGLNAFAADLATAEPRIIACATVLPGEPSARALLDHALGPLGLRGVKIHCHVQCVAPDDPRLDDVYDAAAAHRVPVVIHAGDAPASQHYRCDVRALCQPAAIERALARHPRATVIVPHLGAGRVDEVAALLGRHENLYLDTTMTLSRFLPVDDTMRATEESLVAAWLDRAATLLRAWPGRILYGTDFPNIPYEWTRELSVIAELGLPDPIVAALLGGTARRLFALG